MKQKIRLDRFLVNQYPSLTRNRAQELIGAGCVQINRVVCTKAGMLVNEMHKVDVDFAPLVYVSRAGHKLAHAIDTFNINVTGLIALDAGLSTGGFTDCLLQNGIAKVYGIDVGTDQVHPKIKEHPSVIVMERTHLTSVKSLPDLIDIVTLDLSFISVTKVIDGLIPLLKPFAQMIILIKPQFEVGKERVGKGGIVKDPDAHAFAIAKVKEGLSSHGFACVGIIPSSIQGSDGNTEFLGYFVRSL